MVALFARNDSQISINLQLTMLKIENNIDYEVLDTLSE